MYPISANLVHGELRNGKKCHPQLHFRTLLFSDRGGRGRANGDGADVAGVDAPDAQIEEHGQRAPLLVR